MGAQHSCCQMRPPAGAEYQREKGYTALPDFFRMPSYAFGTDGRSQVRLERVTRPTSTRGAERATACVVAIFASVALAI